MSYICSGVIIGNATHKASGSILYWFGHELQAIRDTWANQLKREDDGAQPTIVGDKRCMGKQVCEKSVLDACFLCFSSY